MGMLALRRGATNLHRSRIQNQAASGPGCAGVLLGPGTVDGSQGQIQRRGVVQRPGVAAAIVSESETYRATFGGALASRELWFGRSGCDRYLSLLYGLVTRVSGRIPFGASCPK